MPINFRRDDGRIDFSDMDRMCTCGHPLGEHSAHGARRCFVGQNTRTDGPVCPCEKFRPTRKKHKAT